MTRCSFRCRTLLYVVGALMVNASVVAAEAQQSATLTGRIKADSGGVAITQAGIRIPELGRIASVDSAGTFRVDQLAAGTYVVIAEAPGFTARRAVVTLVAGETWNQDFVLAKSVHLLATVDVRAKAPPRVTPKMVDFERRRQRGYGRFITRAELERVPGRQLEDVLRATGVAARFIKSTDGQTWLVSSRHAVTSQGFLDQGNTVTVRNTVCHVQVVLDGMIVSSVSDVRAPQVPTGGSMDSRTRISDPRSQVQGGDDPIDLNLFLTDQLEGVEFYPDATMTPVEYNTPAARCGTLVLWTRDR
jgi:Carboxypeptidase regulatory-like domain